MNCDRYIELLSERLDGVIRPEDEKLLAAHLDECDECRAFAELMQAAHLELETMSVEPPETLAAGVMEAVAAERKAAAAPAGRKRRWGRYGALAAAVAVIVLAAYAVPRGARKNSAEFVAVTEDTAVEFYAEAGDGSTASTAGAAEAVKAESAAADLTEREALGDAGEALTAPNGVVDETCEPEDAASSFIVQENSPAANGSAMAPALPYAQTFSAILVYHGTMPAELEGYARETGAETEIYVFVPTREAQHMIESGAYTVYFQGANLSPDAEMAIVVIYGEAPDA